MMTNPLPSHAEITPPQNFTICTTNVTSLTTLKLHSLPLFIQSNHIDILCLQETKIDDHDLDFLRYKLPHMEIYADIGTTTSRGVVSMVRKGIFASRIIEYPVNDDGEPFFEDGRVLCVSLKSGSFESTLLNIYAPVDLKARTSFFENLGTFMSFQSGRFILLGDFNCTLLSSDRLPERPPSSDPSSKHFREILDHYNLTDTHRQEDRDEIFYTYFGARAVSRLDRCYISNDLLQWMDTASNITSLGGCHRMAPCLRITHPDCLEIGKPPWRLQPEVLRLRGVEKGINDMVCHFRPSSFPTDPLSTWLTLKSLITAFLSRKENYHRSRKALKLKRLKDAYTNAANLLKSFPNDSEHLETFRSCVSCLDNYNSSILNSKVEKACLNKRSWTSSTRNFLFRTFRQPTKTGIRGLNIGAESYSTSPPTMLKHASSFFGKLYSRHTNLAATEQYLSGHLLANKFPAGASLCYPFTLNEIKSAIRRSSSHKSPGPDGLPNELYQTYTDQLAPFLLRAFNALLAGDYAPASFSMGRILLIYKKGDAKSLNNYRPITLLNSDYKILTSMLSYRIRPHMANVVGPSQFGFTPGRSCDDNAMTLQFVLKKLNKSSSSESGVLFLDLEKAYDRISHEWLFYTLEKLNFPRTLLSLVKLLYASATSVVSINNYASAPFPITCGVRQGDGLSCSLFNLALIPLYATLNRSPMYKGVLFNDLEVRSLHYADDSVFIFEDHSSLHILEDILAAFCSASNSRINFQKSIFLPIGDPCTSPFTLSDGAPIRHLGYYFCSTGLLTPADFWPGYLPKIHSLFFYYNRLGLSLTAKTMLFNTCILPKILYISSLCPPRHTDTAAINRSLFAYLYNGKRIHVQQCISAAPVSNGGLGVPHLPTLFRTQQIKWIFRFMNTDLALWKACFRHFLKYAYRRMSGISLPWFPFGQLPAPPRSSLPFPWDAALKSWETFHGRLSEPKDFETLLVQPLFSNPFLELPNSTRGLRILLLKGAGSIGEFWNNEARHWNIPSTMDLSPSQIPLTKLALAKIVDCLDYWTDLPTSRNTAAELSAYELSPDGFNFNSLAHFRFNKFYQIARYTITDKQLQASSPISPIILSPDFPYSSKEFWNLVWHRWKDRKSAEFHWRLLQQGLPLGRRLLHILPTSEHPYVDCPTCPCLLTTEHLFSSCPELKPTLHQILRLSNSLWPSLRLEPLPWLWDTFVTMGYRYPSVHFRPWNLLWSIFLYEIWKGRNLRTFRGENFSYESCLYSSLPIFLLQLRACLESAATTKETARIRRAFGETMCGPPNAPSTIKPHNLLLLTRSFASRLRPNSSSFS